MGRKSVAILDVRSTRITIVVGERGVNNTFVFKAMKTAEYSGYNAGVFYDPDQLSLVIGNTLSEVEKICGEKIRRLYIGVPGEFCDVDLKMQEISFPKRRRVCEKDVETLKKSGIETREGMRFLCSGCAVYTTADNRKVIDPIGNLSASLSGIISYFYCTELFARTMEGIFANMKISLVFLPSTLAMACYLIPSETRDEYALMLDVGDQSTSIMILQGNAVLAQQTYPVGKMSIAAAVLQQMQLPYEAVLALIPKTNLYTRTNAGKAEFIHRNNSYEIDLDRLVDAVKDGLDSICEVVSGFLENVSGRELDYKPLYVTGEGIFEIRGALEHVSKRVNRVCEYVAPHLPYYDKPSMSSFISLLDMACSDSGAGGFFNHLFGG